MSLTQRLPGCTSARDVDDRIGRIARGQLTGRMVDRQKPLTARMGNSLFDGNVSGCSAICTDPSVSRPRPRGASNDRQRGRAPAGAMTRPLTTRASRRWRWTTSPRASATSSTIVEDEMSGEARRQTSMPAGGGDGVADGRVLSTSGTGSARAAGPAAQASATNPNTAAKRWTVDPEDILGGFLLARFYCCPRRPQPSCLLRSAV